MTALFRLLLLLLMLMAGTTAARAGAYEAKLPDEVNTARRLCDFVPCAEVFPGATSFSERKGEPPYVEAYRGEVLAGYVMLSTDITDTPAYSGKPVVTLIGMDTNGRFVGVKVLKHSEPILLLGIPESALTKFNDQYLGKSVADKLEIGRGGEADVVALDAISGATVTVIAQNQVMMASGQAVARQTGILPPAQRPPAKFAVRNDRPSWEQLVAEGSVQRLVVQPRQLGLEGAGAPSPFIALWFGGLDHPDIGRALLGEAGWRDLQSRLKPHESAIFVVRTGAAESFKGSGFVRGGLYDRVHLRQGSDSYTFRDLDYVNLYGLQAVGAPTVTESAIFIVRGKGFSQAHPWKLAFLGNRVDRATGTRSFARFDSEVWLPDARLEGGRPAIETPEAPWRRIWRAQALEIAAFGTVLVALAVVYALRERLTQRATRRNKWPVEGVKFAFWAVAIGFVGFGLMAQPSITQVLTWFHALLFRWEWQLFLSDPFVFLFWIFIVVTVFVWGRGLFCGWLCPFGSLSEMLFKLGGHVGLKRFQFALPRPWHDRLKWVKYGVFFGLLAVSMFSMPAAEVLAEIEPFKTTFLVGWGQRARPYTAFAAALLGLSIFIERPFCKYLCPLGASLAMPSTFRWFGLKRKDACSTCKACAVGCGAQAIDAHGRIDHRECLHCLDCMVLYTDTHACPPLAKERKRRETAGLPLTKIGRDGLFIPIHPVPCDPRPAGPAETVRP